MPNASELLEQAAKFRDSATRAHRLAGTVNEADQFVFRVIGISFWRRHPTSKCKPKHWGRLAQMRSRR